MLIIEVLGLLLTIIIGAYTGLLFVCCIWLSIFNQMAGILDRLMIFVGGLIAGSIAWVAYNDIQTFFQTHW